MKYYVYILYSESLDKYYVGHTGEPIAERLRKHLSAHSGFTSKAKDWIVRHAQAYPSKSEAYARELEIKKMKSRKYIEELISSAG